MTSRMNNIPQSKSFRLALRNKLVGPRGERGSQSHGGITPLEFGFLQPDLLIEVGFHDVASDGRRELAVQSGVFPKNRDDDLRLIAGGVGDEPGVVSGFFVFSRILGGGSLGGARFAADIDAREPGAPARGPCR